MPKREPVPPLHDRKEPTLVQKKPGRWVARFRWKGKTTERSLGLSVTPTPKREDPPQKIQKLALRKFTRPYLIGAWSPFEAEPEKSRRGPTVKEAMARFLARYEEGSATRRNYESVLRLFEETLEPHSLVAEVTPGAVRAFVYRTTSLVKLKNGTTSERPVSRSTQKHSHRHLRAFFNWAVKERIVEESPVERVDQPRVEVKAKPFVAPPDVARILDACDERLGSSRSHELAAAYRVALGAGLRRSELLHLQARDVDLDYGHVLIRSKRMDQAEGGEWRPKGRRDRRVPLNGLARTALTERLDAVATPHDLLFSTDGRLTREERLTNALRDVLDDIGLHLPRPLHALRGLFVTYHLLLDWPVPIVQALAGHRDSTVTLGYWRDASTVLWGDGRQRFREAALELGFEPYSGVAAGT